MLTARLRGMRNVDIALATGRHSDRQKARLRVGADIKAARSAINTWLELPDDKKIQAKNSLHQHYPTIYEEPFAYPSLDRELLWGRPQRNIWKGDSAKINLLEQFPDRSL